MTIDEFIDKVAAAEEEWVFETEHVPPRRRIRTKNSYEPHGCQCSTLTALHGHGNPERAIEFLGAAEALGIETFDAISILGAGDMVNGHDPIIRSRLLRACRLKE